MSKDKLTDLEYEANEAARHGNREALEEQTQRNDALERALKRAYERIDAEKRAEAATGKKTHVLHAENVESRSGKK